MVKLPLLVCLLLTPGLCQAKRAVSLMPSYTEIIFALGAGKDLVGVTNFCDWPPEAAKIERTGDYLRPNVEKVYALKPDVVFAGEWASASSAGQLAALGLKVVSVPQERGAADIFATIRLIAAELGRRPQGERLVKELSAAIAGGQPQKPLKVYLEADAGGWTPGGRSFLSDALRLAGGTNIFAGEDRGYFQASWEQVLLLDPEAVILLAGTREEFLARPLAGQLAAVKSGRVLTQLDRDAFSRPGPRLFGEIKRLRALLYGKK
ncbi:MAG: ABC transporter substrate-binding protein [Elusimicrobiales bacterium]|nr:ABC transporter substrate-binding protein [Elusimicrobiales bacterium]